MAASYNTVLTTSGAAKIAAALAAGSSVPIAHAAVGDGGGAPIVALATMAALVHETWRGAPSSLSVDPANPAWVVVEFAVPAEAGGFTVREAGIFDADGVLLAVAAFPDTVKPLLDSGVGRVITIRFVMQLTSAAAVTLQISPSETYATIEGVQTNRYTYGEASGSANALTVVTNPAPAAYAKGLEIAVLIAAANTGPATVNVGGLGAKAVVHGNGDALQAGALSAGAIVKLIYDGTRFRLVSERSNAGEIFTGDTTVIGGLNVEGPLQAESVVSTGDMSAAGSIACAGVVSASEGAGFGSGVTVAAGGLHVSGGAVFADSEVRVLGLLKAGTLVHLDPLGGLISAENPYGCPAQFEYSGTGSNASILSRLETSNGSFLDCQYQGVGIGSIKPNSSGTGVTLLTASDETWKTFDGPLSGEDAAKIIRADPVRHFTWNDQTASPGTAAVGWGAQTSHAISDDLASPGGWFTPDTYAPAVWSPWEVAKDGSIIPPQLVTPAKMVKAGGPANEGDPGAVYRPWGVDQARRAPYLWAAVEWLLDRVDALEAKAASVAAGEP